MGRQLTPKCKQCRRAREKLFLKGEKCFTAKCPIVKRNYPPGVHGPSLKTRISEYGLQLLEKQKAKAAYRLGERQFYKYYLQAMRSKINTGEELLRLLERRLDNVLYRLGLTMSRDQARQIVNHSMILVNGRSQNTPSYSVKTGDKITLKPKTQKMAIFKESPAKKKQELPDWLSFEANKNLAQVINLPEKQDLEVGINSRLIIEYYSR